MNLRRFNLITTVAATFLLLTAFGFAGDIPWTQLSLSTCGVDEYRKLNATHDGRGIVIAVLDTGVEMDVPGLMQTSTGEMKVIDVQDFSTQGDVTFTRALWNDSNDRIVRYTSDGTPELFTPPPAEARPAGTTVWFGLLEEKMFRNSSVPDINDNGEKGDVFGICVVSRDDGTDDDAVCYVDANLNRDFSDEKPLRNYKLNYDRFNFPRTKPEKQTEPMTCAVNIFMKKRMVSIHFDDGGHGTHVAGIAAGHQILGQPGFDGVAPGAKVISLKLGHNSLAGGATTTGAKKAAFEYAANYARENNVTVVCNLSYGIGSMHEGHSDIDKFLDELMRANPNLIVCTSAGNNGPGLSSIGTPAAATAPISVAALLAVDTAADVRGEKIDAPQLTQFSSRGGELDKPDIATPGMMTSTVPRWNTRGDFWQGTSMASPYAAGLCAIIAQSLHEQGYAPRADIVKQAMKASAKPLVAYNALDYGAGVPHLPSAVNFAGHIAMHRLQKSNETSDDDPLYGFDISTESPMAAKGTAPAAYWRGGHVPADRDQVFTVRPIFVPTADATKVTSFSKRLLLNSDAPWCKLQQDQIYLRAKQSADVRVRIDTSLLAKPGLYVATITGVEEWGAKPGSSGTGASSASQAQPTLLRLVTSVVVPHRVSSDSEYTLTLADQRVDGWKVNRHFVEVPAGATAMHLKLKAIEGKPGTAQTYYLFRPDGRSIRPRMAVKIDTKSDRTESSYTVMEELSHGVWEIPITSERAAETSHYSLEVRFDGVWGPHAVKTAFASDTGKASGKLTLTNVFARPATVDLKGTLEGCRKYVTKKLTPDDDTATIPLALTRDFSAVRVKVRVSDEDYIKFTDCAINIYDDGGNAIVQDGLSESEATVRAANPKPGADSVSCKLEIRPAFTHPNRDDSATFEIDIDYLYADPIDMNAKRGDSASTTLYPGIPTDVTFSVGRRSPSNPKDFKRIGSVRAVEKRSGRAIVDVPIQEE